MDNDQIQPGSIAEKLGIDKPDDWFMQKMVETYDLFYQHPDAFTILILETAKKQGVREFLAIAPRPIKEGLMFMFKGLFALGYMKGICKAESDQNWISSWDSKMKGG